MYNVKDGDHTKQMSQASTNPLANKYQVIKQIGTGSFGKIYLAVDKKTSKKVAIKVSNEKHSSKEHLEWEAQVYKAMETSVVPLQDHMWPRVYDVGKYEGDT